jgi:hypothetical protein
MMPLQMEDTGEKGVVENDKTMDGNPLPSGVLRTTVILLIGGPAFFFFLAVLAGPTLVADSVFFLRKKRAFLKQLDDSAVPVVARIFARRDNTEDEERDYDVYSIRYCYEIGNVFYVSKEYVQVKKDFDMGAARLKVSSIYPASGDQHLIQHNFGPCQAVCGCFFGLLFTAWPGTTLFGSVFTSGDLTGYLVVTGILLACGTIIASCQFYFSWRANIINACDIQEDMETVAPTEEYASTSELDETNLETPSLF